MLKHTKPDNSSNRFYYEDISICPICKHNISPNYLCSYLNSDETKLSIYCNCPSCDKFFVILFSKIVTEISNNSSKRICKDIEYSAPNLPATIKFEDNIERLSPAFVNIYNEAHYAEELNLMNICGIGYRKSLEFLIKDYCINLYPDKTDNITASFLGKVIDNYINSNKIKNLSKVSTWLGNDETHYLRKYEDKDINDLKKFINATVAFITYELISDEATSIVESK